MTEEITSGLGFAPAGPRACNGGREARVHHLRATVLPSCTLGLEAADLAMVGATAGPLQRAMHMSHVELGLVGSVSPAVGALATLPAGTLVDRVNRVRLLVASIVLWSGAILLVGASQSLSMLICARSLLGLPPAAAWPAVASLVGDLFDRGERSRIWALVLAGELVGTGVGYLVGGNLAAAASWRVPFWFLVLPTVALAIVLGRRVTDPRGCPSRGHVGGRKHTRRGCGQARAGCADERGSDCQFCARLFLLRR
jgi:MFS family permease